ncbi:MAG TPA: hypothetical protein VMW69_06500 [Spirochaetia bacterium]|nr:hypothetical protein [Spirochaetia bacterium]
MPSSVGVRLVVAAAVSLISVTACSRPITDFSFTTSTGATRLLSIPTLDPGSQGGFLPGRRTGSGAADEAQTTARFTLAAPATLSRGELVSITYRSSSGPLQLHLLVRETGDVVREADFELPRLPDLPMLQRNSTQVGSAVMTYRRPGGAEEGRARLSVSDASRSAAASVRTRAGRNSLHLYPAVLGFYPESVRIETADDRFLLESLTLRPTEGRGRSEGSGSASSLKPIPADLGAIISYNAQWWRRPGLELFSWSLVPSVLVVDFRSLAEQSRFMTRLAFFVEKSGYAGRLWTNRELSGLHGWNAHDYRPDDLAAFFSRAEEQEFSLNPEEIELRSILIANGLILPDACGFKAGTGAIITLSQEGSHALRTLLLTHEGYHGIYFTHPAYRERVEEIWKGVSPQAREIFRLFLKANDYDISNPDLVVNEFQAYLLQQPVNLVDAYFRNHPHASLFSASAGGSPELEAYYRAHPSLFSGPSSELQELLFEAAGVGAGGLVSLELLDR